MPVNDEAAAALRALYEATGGSRWLQNSGWRLDALPCGHGVDARCLQGNTACRQCGAGAAPAPAAGANPLDFLATVITAAKPSSSSK